MEKVLSSELWTTLGSQARHARRKRAAIAYVTKDLIGFKRGDTLVVNASEYAVRGGETNAKLLRGLLRKGVHLYSSDCLHAKVLLLDDVAAIGSSNMSGSSASRLIEVGLMTDHISTVSAVASFIEQIRGQSQLLDSERIDDLYKIKVIRRGWPLLMTRGRRKPTITRLGGRTWVVGVRQLVQDPKPDEQKLIDRAAEKLRKKTGDPELEPDWIRWVGRGRFRRECREGDTLIQIWRSNHAQRPSRVHAPAAVLLTQATQKWTRFYMAEPARGKKEMLWGAFQRFLRQSGEGRKVKVESELLLDSDVAATVLRSWPSSAK